eukprot:611509-Prymnesium_polylepis.1
MRRTCSEAARDASPLAAQQAPGAASATIRNCSSPNQPGRREEGRGRRTEEGGGRRGRRGTWWRRR